jgi:hypothetical protein
MAVRQEIQRESELTIVEQSPRATELDLVVPFTTPELTRAALDAANRMGAGLNAALRLIKVQVVPFPMDPDQSPVYTDFLTKQLEQFESAVLPTTGEIRLARDFEEGLEGTLGRDSIVILATPKRPWKTHTERLAGSLRRRGHKVVLVSPMDKQEAVNA